jgi:hypothetical protein
MKKICLALIMVTLFSICAAAGSPILGKAEIPFEFTVNGQTLHPGMYEVRYIGQGLYRMHNVKDDTGVMINSQSTISQSAGLTLVFRAYGEEHFLAELRDTALQFSAPFSKSQAERLAEKRNKEKTFVALALAR